MHKIEEKNQTHDILLDLKNISLTIDGKKILENISLTLEKGKIKTLIGINGGGKTTLARIIIGALKASSGKITKQKNIKIGHMPQKIQVDKTIPMSVMGFIKLVNDNDLDENLQSWCKRLKIENILYFETEIFFLFDVLILNIVMKNLVRSKSLFIPIDIDNRLIS